MTSKDHVVLICTWADCKDKATVPQIDKTGAVWATLCEMHDKQLTLSLNTTKQALGDWMKTSGAEKEAAATVASTEATEIARTVDALINGGRVRKR